MKAPTEIVSVGQKEDGAKILYRKWTGGKPCILMVKDGSTIDEAINQIAISHCGEAKDVRAYAGYLRSHMRCKIGEREIRKSHWKTVKVESSAVFFLSPRGSSGTGIVGTIAMLAVIVAATVVTMGAAGWAAGALAESGFAGTFATIGGVGLTATGAALASAAGALAGMGVMSLGMLAVNAFCPAATPSYGGTASSERDSAQYSINGATNSGQRYGYVPLLFGEYKITPPLAAKSWTQVVGDDIYFYMCVVWGHEHMSVENIRIGETAISEYTEVTLNTHVSTGNDLTMFNQSVNEISVGADLTTTMTTRSVGECNGVSFDIYFPSGLYKVNSKNGNRLNNSVTIDAQIVNDDTGEVIIDLPNQTITSQKNASFSRSFVFDNLALAKKSIKVRRTTDESTDSYVVDACTFATARGVTNTAPFKSPVPLLITEVKIKASDQLSGYISDLNGICKSVIPAYTNTSGTITRPYAATRNPADHLYYALTSRHALVSPFSESDLDMDSFNEFAQFCIDNEYYFDFVADAESSLWSRLQQICAVSRATFTLDAQGRRKVVIDRDGKTRKQLFTLQNSWDFSVARAFPKIPQALRVSFPNRDDDYNTSEGFVYSDGYDASNATDIEATEFTGITTWTQNWRMGRYYLAALQLRPLIVTFMTDPEWILVGRGDVIGVSNDILMNAYGEGRVSGILFEDKDGNQYVVNDNAELPDDIPVGVVLNDDVDFADPSPARYGLAVRLNDGSVSTCEIIAQYGAVSRQLYFTNPLTWMKNIRVDNVVTVGTLGEEVSDYIVTQITPQEDLQAQITCIPAAPDVYLADRGEIPAWTPPILQNTIPSGKGCAAPVIVNIRSDESMLLQTGKSLISRMGIQWRRSAPIPEAFSYIQASVTAPDGTRRYYQSPVADGMVIVDNVTDGMKYSVFLRFLNPATGATGSVSQIWEHTVVGKTTVPPNVENFTATISSPLGIKLTWDAAQVLDVDHYEITGDATMAVNGTEAMAQVVNKTGELKFYIVAVDVLGLKSATKAEATCTVVPPQVMFSIASEE